MCKSSEVGFYVKVRSFPLILWGLECPEDILWRIYCGNIQGGGDGLKGANTLSLNEFGESIYRHPCLGPAMVFCGCKE